jgi:thiol-disulfide isomerase/thioredoxin
MNYLIGILIAVVVVVYGYREFDTALGLDSQRGGAAEIAEPSSAMEDAEKTAVSFLADARTPSEPGIEVSSTNRDSASKSALTTPALISKSVVAPYPYIELKDQDAYLHTAGRPFTLGEYVGKKIILVSFMTYSCINCQRTFPHLVEWDTTYRDQGLLIVGIHTPEFAFEHDATRVAAELATYGITFPVVLDNDYETWRAYENRFWPRRYIIDITGNVVYDHIGEGDYAGAEAVIKALLPTVPAA